MPLTVVSATDVDRTASFVGERAQELRAISAVRDEYPIVHGNIVNWDNMEKIWHHMFYNYLGIPPEDHPGNSQSIVLYLPIESSSHYASFNCQKPKRENYPNHV